MAKADELLMAHMTVAEMRQALRRTRTVIVPLGCTEQHGYHLPLATDSITAEAVAREAGRRAGVLVAPPVHYTFSGGELPGTVNVSPHVLGLYLREICRSLAQMGLRQIILLTGHGGSENTAGIRDGLTAMLRTEKAMAGVTVLFLSFGSLSATAAEHTRNGDYHSGTKETSLLLHLRPELVRAERPVDRPDIAAMMRADPDAYQVAARHTSSPHELPHISQREDIEVGVMGDPSAASAALGRTLFEESVAGLVELIRQVQRETGQA